MFVIEPYYRRELNPHGCIHVEMINNYKGDQYLMDLQIIRIIIELFEVI